MTLLIRRVLLTLVALWASLALFAAGAQAQPARAAVGALAATCTGTVHLCAASFSLAGGASNKRLTIRLPDTDLHLLSSYATPATERGAYNLAGGHLTLGGSQYVVTLNAAAGTPAGARLFFAFGDASTTIGCGSVPGGVSLLLVSILRTGYLRTAFSCTQARALGAAFKAKFAARLTVRTLVANRVTYHCTLVPVVPRNFSCVGAGTRVRFAGPTGP